MSMAGIFKPVRTRLMSSIRITESGCWEWTKSVSAVTGYGNTSVKGRQMGAHRASFIEFNGPIPDGMCVCHYCDNRLCINPAHLFLGTKTENIKDMVAKGRNKPHAFKPGENLKKLDARKAKEIRGLSCMGMKARELANWYGVSATTIHEVVQGRTYVA